MTAAVRVVKPVVAGDGDPRHGKESTYRNHGCRCDLCTTATVAENRRRREAKRSLSTSG